MLLNDTEYDAVWDRVDEMFRFCPSIDPACIPFVIDQPHTIYDISRCREDVGELIRAAFARCMGEGEMMYALDWQHAAFRFDPRDPEQMKSVYVEDARYFDGGYWAHFPSWYPDGDYYFFIDEQFRFGYLSHPWREEVWIFGECLMAEFEKLHTQLGWTVKPGP